jgi:flagellar protein FlgJ
MVPILPDIRTGKASPNPTAELEREKKLKKACADFEAMMVFQLLKTMRQTIPKDGYLKPSQGQQTYEMMLDQKIAADLAQKGEGLGLQKLLYNQLNQQLNQQNRKTD